MTTRHAWLPPRGTLLISTDLHGNGEDELLTAPMPSGITCPKCGGELVKIGSAKGRKPFWGCENYRAEGDAKCDYKLYTAPIKEPCPKCGASFLTLAGGKKNPVIKCVKDRCDYSRPAGVAEAGADASATPRT